MTINSGDPADNGNGLKKESKYGLAATFALSVAATAAIDGLTSLDLSSLPGWLAQAGALAVAGVVGALTAYKTRNTPSGLRR